MGGVQPTERPIVIHSRKLRRLTRVVHPETYREHSSSAWGPGQESASARVSAAPISLPSRTPRAFVILRSDRKLGERAPRSTPLRYVRVQPCLVAQVLLRPVQLLPLRPQGQTKRPDEDGRVLPGGRQGRNALPILDFRLPEISHISSGSSYTDTLKNRPLV